MEDVAEQIEGDVILVSKPRLPGLELAILAKMHRNRPIIVDVDDYELGFFGNRRPLQLDTIKAGGRGFDTDCPHDEIWTRYSESLIPLFDQVTVSNRELQKRFGGIVLPHVRDAHDFDPALYPRDEIRACLGFSPEDRVIVFAGTPRVHKGYERIVAALEKLNRRDYKFLLVGSPVDRDSRRFLGNITDDNIKTLPNVPFRDLPGYLCAGDLICLLQDEDNPVSRFQMPAKFTDGLAMGIPMLATNLPPLASLANEGLVELLNDTPLEERIDEIFRDYDAHKRAAMRNRQVFLDEYELCRSCLVDASAVQGIDRPASARSCSNGGGISGAGLVPPKNLLEHGWTTSNHSEGRRRCGRGSGRVPVRCSDIAQDRPLSRPERQVIRRRQAGYRIFLEAE